ncbi:exported protein of unknown function [Magnetospirillum sp. XM-1]|nr:exported protein of unknown function [Magnetospirillum sp. XM-1]
MRGTALTLKAGRADRIWFSWVAAWPSASPASAATRMVKAGPSAATGTATGLGGAAGLGLNRLTSSSKRPEERASAPTWAAVAAASDSARGGGAASFSGSAWAGLDAAPRMAARSRARRCSSALRSLGSSAMSHRIRESEGNGKVQPLVRGRSPEATIRSAGRIGLSLSQTGKISLTALKFASFNLNYIAY